MRVLVQWGERLEVELEITSRERLEELLAHLPAAAVLFSGPLCRICHAVAPRIRALLERDFPRMALLRVDIDALPAAAAQRRVLAIPTLLIFFEGRESARFVRAFGIDEVRESLERPYRVMFGEDNGGSSVP